MGGKPASESVAFQFERPLCWGWLTGGFYSAQGQSGHSATPVTVPQSLLGDTPNFRL